MKNRPVVHAPYSKFKGFLREQGLSYRDIADLIGVTVSTVSMKVNGYSDFYLSETEAIKSKYNVERDIFC